MAQIPQAPSSTFSPGRRLLITAALLALAGLLIGPPAGAIGILGLLLLGPGYLLERLAPAPRPPALARLAVWVGLSLSAVALLYLWCSWAGLALSSPLLWALTVALAAAALGASWRDLGAARPSAPRLRYRPELLTIPIFALTVGVRMVQIADLALPPWVDSLHHALMVRVAAETGMVPSSLRPYLPVDDLPYHWGYHVFAATVMRLGGLALPEALLIPGQLLNAMVGLAVAGLAHYLWRRPLAAPVAALVVGLLSIMPAYYVSWGRYTQLSGLLMLPGLAIVWGQALQHGGRWRWLLVSLLLAGMSLVHVRVLIFSLALIAAQAIVWGAGQPWPALARRGLAALAAGAGAGALTAPWLWLLARRALLPALATADGLAGGGAYNALNTGLLWTGRNEWLIALALLGAWLGLRRRAGAAATLLAWVGLLAVASNPWLLPYIAPGPGALLMLWGLRRRSPPLALAGLGLLLINPRTVSLPYLWLITNDVVVISLFMPLALLIGGGAALLYDRLRAAGRWPPALAAAGAVGLLALSGWAAYDQRGVVNQSTVLATAADRAAIAWAAENTPPAARFLVNSAGWLRGAPRGADGGWWLLPLAGRWTSAPPVLFIYGDPAYVRAVNATEKLVAGYAAGQEQAIIDLIGREAISHIYLGAKGGPLKPELFAGRPGFRTIYERGGVTIIAVDRAALAEPQADPPRPGSHQARTR